MVESAIPAAAVMAAPMRKLWPEYFDWSTPAATRALRTSLTNKSLVK